MAYQQTLPRFNPYIHTTPVEDSIKIGMYKQQKYDENIQKVQNWIDQTAALPLLRPFEQQLLQSKINGFVNSVTQMNGADFSQQQVMNSVAGMSSAISKDPVIINGVSSYYNHKGNIELMNKAREKGELTPQNEDMYNKHFSEFLQSTDPNRVWSGKYEPYFDRHKFIKEKFDEIKPDGRTLQDFFQMDGSTGMIKTDANGVPIPSVLVTREMSGYQLSTAQSILADIMQDPRVQRQLQIDGEYMNKGIAPEQLASSVKSLKASSLTTYNSKKQDMLAKKAAGQATDEDLNRLEADWKSTSGFLEDLEKSATSNPDYVRGLMYKETTKENLLNKYAEKVKSTKIEKNPFFEMTWDIYKQEHLSAKEKIELELKGYGVSGGYTTFMPSDADALSQYDRDWSAALTQTITATDKLLLATVLSDKQAEYRKMLQTGNFSEDEAAARIVKQAAKEAGFGDNIEKFRAAKGLVAKQSVESLSPDALAKNPILSSLLDSYNVSFQNYNIVDATRQKYLQQLPGGKDIDLKGIEDITIRDMSGNPILVTKQDFIDLGTVLNHKSSGLEWANTPQVAKAAEDAAKRLKERGKDYLIDAMLTQKGGSWNVAKTAFRKVFPGSAAGNVLLGPDISKFFEVMDRVEGQVANDGFRNAMAIKAKVIRDNYNIQPNISSQVLTGKNEIDESRLMLLSNIIGGYGTYGQNLGDKFNPSEMVNYINDPKKKVKSIAIESRMVPSTGKREPWLVIYDEGQEKYNAVISREQAKLLGTDMDKLYEPPLITGIRNMIGTTGATTMADPMQKQTYRDGHAALFKFNFPYLKESPYDVKGNIVYTNGLYHGVIYANDGQKDAVRALPGKQDLSEAVNGLLNANSLFIQYVLNGK